MKKTDEKYPLYSLLIEITQKCNAACEQCGSRCDIHSEEKLEKKAIIDLFHNIKENIGTYTMINISGGEPLLRKDLFEIMTEATEMGFEWGMVTNGSLITEDVVSKMKSSGMKTITISLDGLRETHESLRHLPGSFDKIINALRMIKAAGFTDHLQVTFTANRRNVYEFEELYSIINEIGIDSIRVSFIDPIGRALDNKDLFLTREEILYLTDFANKVNADKKNVPIIWGCPHYLGKLLDRRKFFCFTGIYAASILFNGDIFVCPNVPRRPEFIQGNILKDSFSEVWRNKFEYFRNRPLPEQCKDCEYKDKCKGDSLHTMDFDTGKPKFCFKEMIENQDAEGYKKYLFDKYADISFCEISGDDENVPEMIIEPDAFDEIRTYFHLGKKHPSSMYEQQMALIGFEIGNLSVVRYVIACNGLLRSDDNAIFSKKVLQTVDSELKIINRNYYKSDDRSLIGSESDNRRPMKFLGFIHSHPTQSELQYSTGDDRIHGQMTKKYGWYTGILVNPSEGTIGAYSTENEIQSRLIIPSVESTE